ncbi:MAG: response regulator [Verrucomicrobiota bacterium]
MILLVEDDPDDLFLMERALLKARLSVSMHHARNGQEAMDYLQAVGPYSDRSRFPLPALMLLDLKMPFVNGFEVLLWLRQNPALHRFPVIVLTSSLEESDRQKALELGATGFFIKPPTRESLLQMIQLVPGFPIPPNAP